MALLPILKYPDSRLKIEALPVQDDEFETLEPLIVDMFETLYEDNGAGLAAPQVNVSKQVVVIDISDTRDQRLVLINPVIVHHEGAATSFEGCLSIPEFYEKVTRSEKIAVKAQDQFGKPLEFEASGRLAICIQHELDHLKGILFIDRLPVLKRKMLQRKLEKLNRRRY